MPTAATVAVPAAPAIVRREAAGASTATVAPEPVGFRLGRLKLVVLCAIVGGVSFTISEQPRFHPLNAYLTVVWSIYFPVALVGFLGALQAGRRRPSSFAGVVPNKVVFLIPTIGRSDVEPALHRVIRSILACAPANLACFRIDVVLEEGAEVTGRLAARYRDVPQVRLLEVPAGYGTANGTRFKARANQFALERRTAEGESTDDVFVYHLDDDTAVGTDTIASLAEFVAADRGRYHLAQGVLAFPHQLSRSLFCRLADSGRPSDDLTRFFFFTSVRGKPLGGLHGEHLLVRASVEAEIGWDFGPRCTVEDAYFGLRFAERYPGRSTFLNSCSYGASPDSIGDLVKQRRRWAGGLFALVFDRGFAWKTKGPLGYLVLNWSIGLFQHVAVILALSATLGVFSTSPINRGVLVVWSFNLGYHVWVYLEGLRINLQASATRRHYPGYALLTSLLIVVFSLVESWASWLGFWDFVRRRDRFVVITKGR